MRAKLVGILDVEYTDKKTGALKKGKEFHLIREPSAYQKQKGFTGLFVEKKWVGLNNFDLLPASYSIGDILEFDEEIQGQFPILVGVSKCEDVQLKIDDIIRVANTASAGASVPTR